MLTTEELDLIELRLERAAPRPVHGGKRFAIRPEPGLEHGDWHEAYNPHNGANPAGGAWHDILAAAEQVVGISRADAIRLLDAARIAREMHDKVARRRKGDRQ